MGAFELLENRKIDIDLLQEIYSTPKAAKIWEKMWKRESLWHSRPSPKYSCVAIILRQNSKLEIVNVTKDQEGLHEWYYEWCQ